LPTRARLSPQGTFGMDSRSGCLTTRSRCADSSSSSSNFLHAERKAQRAWRGRGWLNHTPRRRPINQMHRSLLSKGIDTCLVLLSETPARACEFHTRSSHHRRAKPRVATADDSCISVSGHPKPSSTARCSCGGLLTSAAVWVVSQLVKT
jgi:hypothetical protein